MRWLIPLSLLVITSAGVNARAVNAQPLNQPGVISGIEAIFREQFPRSTIEPFECATDRAKTMCKNLVSHPTREGNTIGVNYIVKVSNGELQGIVAIMAGPSVAKTRSQSQYMAMIYTASAIAVLTATSPEIQPAQRATFIKRVLDSGDRGVKKGPWDYTGGSALFATFSAARLN